MNPFCGRRRLQLALGSRLDQPERLIDELDPDDLPEVVGQEINLRNRTEEETTAARYMHCTVSVVSKVRSVLPEIADPKSKVPVR